MASSPVTDPIIIQSLRDLRGQIMEWKGAGETIAFVPTMGALHAGHVSLISLAKTLATKTVASIYVNPTQFAPTEDFGAYPRTEQADVEKLAAVGCDMIYIPDSHTMYDDAHATHIKVGGVADGLETDHRPTFFEGVALVVTKLLNRVQPDIAIFGEKDYQQLATIRRLVADLDMPIQIIGAPIARDDQGLALSSRNAYFDSDGLAIARKLNTIMFTCSEAIAGGQAIEIATEVAMRALLMNGFDIVDYVSVADADSLIPIKTGVLDVPGRLLIAAHCPAPDRLVRLIDNCAIKTDTC